LEPHHNTHDGDALSTSRAPLEDQLRVNRRFNGGSIDESESANIRKCRVFCRARDPLPSARSDHVVAGSAAREPAVARRRIVVDDTLSRQIFVQARVRRGHRTYVPKPQKTYDLRKFYAKHTKTDGEDASGLGRVRHVDPEGVYELSVPTAAQTTVKFLVKQRARLVADASRAKQRIRSWLQLGNPLLIDAFGDNLFGKVGRAFLRRHLDPFRVCERGFCQLRRFFSQHTRGLVHEQQLEQVWAACQGSCALYAELRAENRLPFDSATLQELVTLELDSIEFFENQSRELETKISAVYRELDPHQSLVSVAGVGDVIAPPLEALIGNIERFPTRGTRREFFLDRS
jgi:Transposase